MDHIRTQAQCRYTLIMKQNISLCILIFEYIKVSLIGLNKIIK